MALVFSSALTNAQSDSLRVDSVIQNLKGKWHFYVKIDGLNEHIFHYSDYWGYEQDLTFFQTAQDEANQSLTYWRAHDHVVVDIGTFPVSFHPVLVNNVLLPANLVDHFGWEPGYPPFTFKQNHPDTIPFKFHQVAHGPTYVYNRVKAPTSNETALANEDQLTLFPNPATDRVNLLLTEPTNHLQKLSLFDINGQLVRSEAFTGNSFILQREQLPSGTYFLNLESGDKIYQSRLLIY